MNRRAFLGMLGGVALNQAIPFNRVCSFPKKIVLPPPIGRHYETRLARISEISFWKPGDEML